MGPGCEFETLRGALGVVGAYDRVVLHPGVYEEQAEVALKVPVELVGLGRLGEVALLVCMEQQCPTARLCNLVFMPPWFSTVVYKVKQQLVLMVSSYSNDLAAVQNYQYSLDNYLS